MIVTWNADPVLLHLGPIEIRWYGALFAAALLVGFWIMGRIYRREGQDERELDPLSLYAVLGVVIGARLGHVLFYDPGFYFTHPLEILKVWKGGLASHGAGIGLFIALYLFTRRYPTHSYLWLLDRLTLPAALGGAFIRLGNFFNSEILGKPTGADWGIIFERVDSIPRNPVQLYESLG